MIPSFFGTIVGTVYIAYQIFAFKHSHFFGGDPSGYLDLIQKAWDFLGGHTMISIGLIGVAILVLIFYMFTPIIFTGSLIDLVAKAHTGRELNGGLAAGMIHFLPMFEFSAMTSPFHFIAIFTESSFVLRNLGTGMWFFLLPVIVIFGFVGLILTMIFAYAEQYIVLEDKPMGEAISLSARLVVENLRQTLFLGIMMIFISARVFLNVIIILFLPLLVILLTAFLASILSPSIGVTIGLAIGLALLTGASYILGGFTVYQNAVWTISFLEFRKKQMQAHTEKEDAMKELFTAPDAHNPPQT